MHPDQRVALLDAVALGAAVRQSVLGQPRHEETLAAHRARLETERQRLSGGEPCAARDAGLDLLGACERALACCAPDGDPLQALEEVARHAASVERMVPDHVPGSAVDWTRNPIV